MFKRTVSISILAAFLLFVSCEDDKKDPKEEFLGQWKAKSMTMSGTLWEEPFNETEDFSMMDSEFWVFFEFKENTAKLCANDLCTTDYECDESEVEYESDVIRMPGYDDTFDLVAYSYTFSDNTLTLSYSIQEEDISLNITIVLEKFSGTFPPASWSVIADNDAYEPDNNIAQSKEIALGSAGQDKELICSVDFVHFAAESGKSYRIDIDSDFDSYLVLYDSDGNFEDENDDSFTIDTEGNEADATLEWDCYSTGTYYVRISDLGYEYWDEMEEFGDYNISVEEISGSAKSTPRLKKGTLHQRIKQYLPF